MKLLFVSLGCDKNRVDSERMLGTLLDAGYELTDDESDADVIIINSCCFIDDAKEESIQTILEMAELKRDARLKALVVTGCLSERYRDEVIKEIPEVDAVLGTDAVSDIADAVNAALGGERYEGYTDWSCATNRRAVGISPSCMDKESESDANCNRLPRRVLTTAGHYAYLKIAEGCDKRCTYCIIPHIRGGYRSYPIEDLVAEAKGLVDGGVKELVLVAQETAEYGIDLYGEKSLHRLLDELNAIPRLFWIRILYCYPEEIYDGLIDAMIRDEKVCHYLDIPIQHANDDILRRMGRRTTKADIVSVIMRLKERMPDIALRTTVICGFPGETDEQHEELMQFVNDMEFDRLGAFSYSQEEGTPAAEFSTQVPDDVKNARRDAVMELEKEVIADKNEAMVGRELYALIEGKVADEDAYVGRTYRDAPDVDGYIFIQTDEELVTGDVVRLRVTGAYEYDLIGELA